MAGTLERASSDSNPAGTESHVGITITCAKGEVIL